MSRHKFTAFLTTLITLLGSAAGLQAQYARKTPIVEAVQKTKASIVTIKVEKRGDTGKSEIVGTGVVVDERGFVVTNRHVCAAAEHIIIMTGDGSELHASIQAEDARYDLAILKCEAGKRLPELMFGPSSDLMVGETVIAVGHPYGYTHSVSTGIISALDREITMPSGETLGHLIQTNASINPGNSGGPLLNINGELIGINVALREGAQGIAFALPAETVQRVLARHLSAAAIAKIAHGLVLKERVSDDGPRRQHVLIEKVVEGNAAAKADLQTDDQILRVGDRIVRNRFDVERALWSYSPGQRVAVVYARHDRESTAWLTLTKAADASLAGTRAGALKRPSWAVPDAHSAKGPK